MYIEKTKEAVILDIENRDMGYYPEPYLPDEDGDTACPTVTLGELIDRLQKISKYYGEDIPVLARNIYPEGTYQANKWYAVSASSDYYPEEISSQLVFVEESAE